MSITGILTTWGMEYFDKKLRRDHGGRLTQAAAVAMATRDKDVQRRTQKLTTPAADFTWGWVTQMKQNELTIGEVWRPELGILGTPMVLWELQAQASTGWNMEVRGLISKDILEKVVLSRKVLQSIHRVSEGDRAEEHRVSVGDLQNMDLGPIMMTPQIAQKVWKNVNKLKGLKETRGTGRRRYRACIDMLMWEGVIEGEVGVHPQDMGWEGMAEEMFRLQRISRGKPYVYAELLALRDGAQSKESEGDQDDGRLFWCKSGPLGPRGGGVHGPT